MNGPLVNSFVCALAHLGAPAPIVADEHPTEQVVWLKWNVSHLNSQDMVNLVTDAFNMVNHDFNKRLNSIEFIRVCDGDESVAVIFEVH